MIDDVARTLSLRRTCRRHGCIVLNRVLADDERGVIASAGRKTSDSAIAENSKYSLKRIMANRNWTRTVLKHTKMSGRHYA